MTSTIPHWPCPNNCLSWCRTDGSMTNHHPRCEFVDESLIDVWRVTILPGDKGGCICGSEAEARMATKTWRPVDQHGATGDVEPEHP